MKALACFNRMAGPIFFAPLNHYVSLPCSLYYIRQCSTLLLTSRTALIYVLKRNVVAIGSKGAVGATVYLLRGRHLVCLCAAQHHLAELGASGAPGAAIQGEAPRVALTLGRPERSRVCYATQRRHGLVETKRHPHHRSRHK